MVLVSRRWIFTSYEKSTYEDNKDSKLPATFISYQGEFTKTNRKHVQGYVEFGKQKTRDGVKKYLGSSKIHCKIAKGTAEENIQYTSKTDSADPKRPHIMWGTPIPPEELENHQGKRSDLLAVYEMIKKGFSEFVIMDTHPKTWMRYHRAITKARGMWIKRKLEHYNKKLKVTCYFGETRAGKTRTVYKKHKPENVFKLVAKKGEKLWFDGYSGENVLLIDEFNGQISIEYMLQLLDNYWQQLEVKGAFCWAQFDHIYITSNHHPAEWYNCYEGVSDAHADALGERVHFIEECIRKIPKRPNRWVRFRKRQNSVLSKESHQHKSDVDVIETPSDQPKVSMLFPPKFETKNSVRIFPEITEDLVWSYESYPEGSAGDSITPGTYSCVNDCALISPRLHY